MATNLPAQPIEDSAAATKLYFENYGETALEFPANDVTAAISFFQQAGFDLDAASTSASVILRQAKPTLVLRLSLYMPHKRKVLRLPLLRRM